MQACECQRWRVLGPSAKSPDKSIVAHSVKLFFLQLCGFIRVVLQVSKEEFFKYFKTIYLCATDMKKFVG